MLDEQKVKLMTKMASYEQNEGKEDLKVSAYYRKDYASLNTIFSVIWITIGYVCLILLIGLAALEFISSHASMGAVIMMGIGVVVAYLIIVISYGVATHHYYNKKHQDARTRVKKYNHEITRLLKSYAKENQ